MKLTKPIILLIFCSVCSVGACKTDKETLVGLFSSCDTIQMFHQIGDKALRAPKVLLSIVVDPGVGDVARSQAVFFLGKLVFWDRFPETEFQNALITRLYQLEKISSKPPHQIEEEARLTNILSSFYYSPQTNYGLNWEKSLGFGQSLFKVLASKSLLETKVSDQLCRLLAQLKPGLSDNETEKVLQGRDNILSENLIKGSKRTLVVAVFRNFLAQLRKLPTKTDIPADYFDKKHK